MFGFLKLHLCQPPEAKVRVRVTAQTEVHQPGEVQGERVRLRSRRVVEPYFFDLVGDREHFLTHQRIDAKRALVERFCLVDDGLPVVRDPSLGDLATQRIAT